MKYIFDKHLYREGLRQTKGMGLASVALAVMGAIVLPLVYLVSTIKNYANTDIKFISDSGFAGGLHFFAYIIPFLILVRLFSFLFKRGASDFYHALPYTRQCIYFTNLAIAITWYLISVVGSCTCAAILYLVNSKIRFSWISYFNNILVYLVLMLFISGAILIAMSIVGKSGVAIELGIFIAALPRVIMLFTLVILQDVVPIIEGNYVTYFSTKYNLVMELSIGALSDYSGYLNCFRYAPGIIVTLLEALVYIGIGLWLFSTRRSEVAENAAPNFKALVVIQSFFALFIFIIGAGASFEAKSFGPLFVALIVGTCFYLFYSIFTLRKVKIALKSLVGIPILLVISFVYYAFLGGVSSSIVSKVPDASDIKAITILDQNTSFLTGFMGMEKSYNDILKENMSFSSDKISEAVARDYKYSCEKIEGEELNSYSNHELVRIYYKNGSSVVRNLYSNPKAKDQESIKEVLLENEKYAEAATAIPEEAEPDNFRADKYNKELWECFKEEAKTLTAKQKSKIINRTSNWYMEDYYSDEIENGGQSATDLGDNKVMFVTGMYQNQIFYNGYTIFEKLTPKTYKLYTELEYKDSVDIFHKLDKKIRNNSINSGYSEIAAYFDLDMDGVHIYNLRLDSSIYEGKMEGGNLVLEYEEEIANPQLPEEGEDMEDPDFFYKDTRSRDLVVNINDKEFKSIYEDIISLAKVDTIPNNDKPMITIRVEAYDYRSNSDYSGCNFGVNYDEEALKALITRIIKEYGNHL